MQRLKKQTIAPHNRLGTQIALTLGIVVILLFIFQGLLISRLVRDELAEQTLDNQQASAQSATVSLRIFWTTQQMELVSITQSPIWQRGIDYALQNNPNWLEVVVYDAEGTPIAQNSAEGQQPLLQAQPAWLAIDYYVSSIVPADTPYVIVSRRLMRQDTPYVLSTRINADTLCQIINQIPEHHDTTLYLLETTQAYSCATHTLQRITAPDFLLQTEHPYAGAYQHPPNGRQLGATAQVPGTSWVVVSQADSGVALQAMRQVNWIIAGVGIAGFCLMVSFSLSLTKLVTRPIKQLTASFHQIEIGDSHLPIDIPHHKEFKPLTDAFKHMSEAIADRERKLQDANRMLQSRSDELAELSRRTIRIEEEERKRISRELHDSFGQTLAAMKINVDVAQRMDDLAQIRQLLHDAGQIAEQALDEIHTISQDLRPTVIDDLGLLPALEWYINQFQQRFQISAEIKFEPIDESRLSSESTITAYRFLQETLTNVYKHAHAKKVTIRLKPQANFMMLSIKDDGQGFNTHQQNRQENTERIPLGISNLRERLTLVGGEMVLHSELGEGTTIIALIPMLSKSEYTETKEGN